MPHGITQCYLPPGRGDMPALSSSSSSSSVIATFHHTDPTGPARTRADPNDPDLRETPLVRAGLRQSPRMSGRARVVEFSVYIMESD